MNKDKYNVVEEDEKSDYEIFPVLKSEITAKSKLKREKFIDKFLSLFS